MDDELKQVLKFFVVAIFGAAALIQGSVYLWHLYDDSQNRYWSEHGYTWVMPTEGHWEKIGGK